MWRLIIGIGLFSTGLIFAQQKVRPWMDYDFILGWYGIILLLDFISTRLGQKSIFINIQNVLLLAFSSSILWWFYETVNIYLQNWSYESIKKFYEPTEWGVFSTIAFATVIFNLFLWTNIIKAILIRNPVVWLKASIKKPLAFFLVGIGIFFLILNISLPLYSFPLVWLILLFTLDPINALQKRRSLFIQLFRKNFKPILVLGLASFFAGLTWETMNFLIPKWTYPIAPWFWALPEPITTKLFHMPLAGYLGYIPFIYSAFAFIEFLGIGKNWLKN